MFTGIATHKGFLKAINLQNKGEYTIESNINLSKSDVGSSILCSGICLTVVSKKKKRLN